MLAADGVDTIGVRHLVEALAEEGVTAEVLAPTEGELRPGGEGDPLRPDRQLNTMASVLYDAVVVPCGPSAIHILERDGYALHFVAEAYKHGKPVAAFGSGLDLLRRAGVTSKLADDVETLIDQGVVTTTAAEQTIPDGFFASFITQVSEHRSWLRKTDAIPA